MIIPDELVPFIIRALRIAISNSFSNKRYFEEKKFNDCLLKIQQLERESNEKQNKEKIKRGY